MMQLKIFFLATTILLFGINSNAQTFDWAKSLGGTVTDLPNKIIVDANGNVYTCGYFNGTADFDPGPGVYNLVSAGGTDCFISKVDASGSFVWAVRFGGTGSDGLGDIALDGSNIVATGSFLNTVDFDPGVGTSNLTALGSSDLFIIKLDANGNLIWVKQMGGSGSSASGNSLALFGGDYYVLGSFSATIDVDPGIGITNLTSAGAVDFFICKLDGPGNLIWVKTIGGTGNDDGLNMKVDPMGNILFTSNFENTVDFDPGPGVFNMTAGPSAHSISKLDASGNFVWAYQGSFYIRDLNIDISGDFCLTGVFLGTIDFDLGPGVLNLTSTGGFADIFVVKFDTDGNLIWAKRMGSSDVLGDAGNSIFSDSQKNVYTTGYFSATSDFDPGAGTFNLVSGGSVDAFISKLDSLGNFVWAGKLSGTNSVQGLAIALDSLGNNIFVTGRYQSAPVDFDASAGVFNMTPVGGTDVFIVKYTNCSAAPSAPGSITGSIEVCNGSTNTYSIAPVSGATTYTWTLPSGWTGTSTTTSINATASSTSGNITVTANNACGTSTTQTLAVTVGSVIPSTPGSISGSSTICLASNNTYSVTNDPSATSYTWTLPSGWSGTSTTNSITTTASSIGGNITVTANNSCGSSTAATLAITVNTIPSTPGSISGNTTICSGISNAYSVSSVAGATTYSWTLPAGWSGSSTTNFINITPTSTSGNIMVTADNSCGSSSASSLAITVNTIPATPGSITGANPICEGTTSNYSVSTIAGATSYTWTLPSGWSGTSTTNLINAIANSTSGNITVTANNVCGNSAASTLSVVANAMPSVSLNLTTDLLCEYNASIPLSGGTPSGGFYTGTGVSGGNFDPAITGTGIYQINYTFTDANSCTNTASDNMTVDACLGVADQTTLIEIQIYPSPTTGIFTLVSSLLDLQTGIILIYNSIGEVVQITKSNTEINQFDISSLSDGIYYVQIMTNEITINKRIIKQ